jgi:hypothetical protein
LELDVFGVLRLFLRDWMELWMCRLVIQAGMLKIHHMKIYAQAQLDMLKLFKLLIMLML